MTDVVPRAALQIAEDLATLLVGAEESRHAVHASRLESAQDRVHVRRSSRLRAAYRRTDSDHALAGAATEQWLLRH
jgi:hypothetical protein